MFGISDHILVVMKLILLVIYSNFETAIVDDTGIEQTDTFMASPEGGQLTLSFKS